MLILKTSINLHFQFKGSYYHPVPSDFDALPYPWEEFDLFFPFKMTALRMGQRLPGSFTRWT